MDLSIIRKFESSDKYIHGLYIRIRSHELEEMMIQKGMMIQNINIKF